MDPQTPLIVAFVGDLMFTTRIDNVIRHLGYQVRWVEDPSTIVSEQQVTKQEVLGERLHGPEGQLFKRITAWQPHLLTAISPVCALSFPIRTGMPGKLCARRYGSSPDSIGLKRILSPSDTTAELFMLPW